MKFFYVVFVLCSITSFSQTSRIEKKGLIVYNRPLFKHFAVLMQDTTLSGNRFDNAYDDPWDIENFSTPKGGIIRPALIVDSNLSVECDERLLNHDSLIHYNFSKGKLPRKITRYIRLYIGYIGISGQVTVVCQLLRPREYKKHLYIYDSELFLVVPAKSLYFAVIRF